MHILHRSVCVRESERECVCVRESERECVCEGAVCYSCGR